MSKSFEIESQLILRVPDQVADQLNIMFEKEDSEDFVDLTPFICKSSEGEDLT